MNARLLCGVFTVLLLILSDASGEISECPHRVVPESWDRDRSTLNYNDIHVFVFGGPKGLRLKGTCDNAIAKWKDDINLHSKCEVVGLKYFNSEGSLVDVTSHDGFQFNRDKTGARASLTFLKVEEDQLAKGESFYYDKTFYVDIDNCGTRDKTGCLLFRIEEADDGLECGNDGEGDHEEDEDGDDGSDGDGDDGSDGDGDDGSDGDGDDGSDEDGDDGSDEDGEDGSDEDGDDGSDEDGDDGSNEDGDDDTDGDGDDGSDEDGDDGSDTSTTSVPGASNERVVADEPTDAVSGAAVGLPVALTALFAGIILAVLVIAALLIRRIKKPNKPSLQKSPDPSINSHSGLDNPAYGEIPLHKPPNPSMDNPTYGSAPAPPNPSMENPVYATPEEPIYDSIGTQLEDPDEIYQTL